MKYVTKMTQWDNSMHMIYFSSMILLNMYCIKSVVILAGANGVAAGSSLARPRHRWWKGPIQIGCENFHRWRHYLKLVKIPWNFTYIFFDENSIVRH